MRCIEIRKNENVEEEKYFFEELNSHEELFKRYEKKEASPAELIIELLISICGGFPAVIATFVYNFSNWPWLIVPAITSIAWITRLKMMKDSLEKQVLLFPGYYKNESEISNKRKKKLITRLKKDKPDYSYESAEKLTKFRNYLKMKDYLAKLYTRKKFNTDMPIVSGALDDAIHYDFYIDGEKLTIDNFEEYNDIKKYEDYTVQEAIKFSYNGIVQANKKSSVPKELEKAYLIQKTADLLNLRQQQLLRDEADTEVIEDITDFENDRAFVWAKENYPGIRLYLRRKL